MKQLSTLNLNEIVNIIFRHKYATNTILFNKVLTQGLGASEKRKKNTI